MDDPEHLTHSFIVKVWLEETAEEAGKATWRGRITHVPSGEQRYIQELDSIAAFIVPYLGRLGAKIPMRWRLWHWLKQARKKS